MEILTHRIFNTLKNDLHRYSFVSMPKGILLNLRLQKGKEIGKSSFSVLAPAIPTETSIEPAQILNILRKIIPGKSRTHADCLAVLTYGVSPKRLRKAYEYNDDGSLTFDDTYEPALTNGELECQKFRLEADLNTGISKDPFLFVTSDTGSDILLAKELRHHRRVCSMFHYDKNIYSVAYRFRSLSIFNPIVLHQSPYVRHGHKVILNRTPLFDPIVKSKHKANLPYGFLMLVVHTTKTSADRFIVGVPDGVRH